MEFMREANLPAVEDEVGGGSDAGPLGAGTPKSFLARRAGPFRAAPKEGQAGCLAPASSRSHTTWRCGTSGHEPVTAEAASYEAQQTVICSSGSATGYGLGINIGTPDGHRRISHGGAVSGYTTSSEIFPDDRTAIVVFTNIYPGAAGVPGRSQVASQA